MKDYQIWGFTYLNYNGINAITDDYEESYEEFNIPCFDGLAWFSANGKYYLCYYPKMKDLSGTDLFSVELYCGHDVGDGDYGIVMGALGKIREVSKEMFDMTVAVYPVTTMDEDNLG